MKRLRICLALSGRFVLVLLLFCTIQWSHAEQAKNDKESKPLADSPETQALLKPMAEAEWWAQRVDKLIQDIALGLATTEQADDFYLELRAILTHQRTELIRVLNQADTPEDALQGALKILPPQNEDQKKAAIRVAALAELDGYILDKADTVIALYDSVHTLYWARVRLLQTVSQEMRAKVTGTFETGVRELEGEFQQIQSRFELSQLKLSNLSSKLLTFSKQVPLLVLRQALHLAIVILAFYWWRRWAKDGLPKLQALLLDLRPRRKITMKLVRAIWYVDRVRSPLEWMLLSFGVFSAVDVRGFGISIFYEFGVIFFKWIFLAWLAVEILNALADRRTGRVNTAFSSIRVRSTRLIAAWLVLLSLGLNMADNYTGKATLHEWVLMGFWVLLIPVGLLLLNWWRPEVQRQLKEEVQKPKWVADILATRKGFMSYRAALIGIVYMFALKIQRQFISTINELESGRRFLGNFLYRETARQYEQTDYEEGQPVSEELRETLLADEGSIYDKYGRQEIKELVELVRKSVGGVAAVVGERGTGKSVFVQRLIERTERQFIVVECPVGEGFEGYRRSFMEALGLPDQQSSVETINHRLDELNIKVIIVDSFHRLTKPVLGGQVEVSKLSEFMQQLERDIFHIVTLNKAAWQYLRRVRAKNLLLEQVVILPPWTEEQIAELIQLRTKAAGIEPDYGRFILPPLFDEAELKTMEERRRFGFYRILWTASDGNPEVALRLYVKSLAVLDDGKIIVKMPIPPNIEQLDAAETDLLLILRVIAQSGYATPADVHQCLGMSFDRVENTFRVMQWRGWIESVNGYYRITWRWYRAVTRVLIRQNLLAR